MRNEITNDGRTDRRTYLKALGVGATAIAAFGGVGSAHDNGDGGNGRIPVDKLADGNALISDHEVHPVYGFSSQAAKVAPPVEPDHEVQALIKQGEGGGFFFQPTGLYIEPGDTVQFTMATPHHNVVAYHPQFGYRRRIPYGVMPFSGPMLPQGGYWLYTFEKPGVYEMNCAPHEILGMAMRIVVGEVSGPAADPLPDLCAQPPEGGDGEGGNGSDEGGDGGGEGSESGGLPLRPPELTAYTVLSDPAIAPERLVEEGSVNWEAIDPQNRQLFVRTEGFPPCADSGN